jgi:hypothetical protein
VVADSQSISPGASVSVAAVSIPPRAYTALPAEPLAGKPVLDTMNYIPQRDGRIPELYGGPLARPAGATDRSALPIAGDDPTAKAAVRAFLDAIGYDTVDAGTLATGGRRFDRHPRLGRTVWRVGRRARHSGRRGGNSCSSRYLRRLGLGCWGHERPA